MKGAERWREGEGGIERRRERGGRERWWKCEIMKETSRPCFIENRSDEGGEELECYSDDGIKTARESEKNGQKD